MTPRDLERAREIVREWSDGQLDATYVTSWGEDALAARIAAAIAEEREQASAQFVHQPYVKDGVAVCARCGVVVPVAPTCCRGTKPAIRARGGA